MSGLGYSTDLGAHATLDEIAYFVANRFVIAGALAVIGGSITVGPEIRHLVAWIFCTESVRVPTSAVEIADASDGYAVSTAT